MENMPKLLCLNLMSLFSETSLQQWNIMSQNGFTSVSLKFGDHPIMSTPMPGMRRKGQAQTNRDFGRL